MPDDEAWANAYASSTNGTGTHSATTEPWEAPVPFPDEIKLPPFPTDKLPPWMADYIVAEALATQTPPDLAGMLTLGVAGGGSPRKSRSSFVPAGRSR